jgi:hypothetical protein
MAKPEIETITLCKLSTKSRRRTPEPEHFYTPIIVVGSGYVKLQAKRGDEPPKAKEVIQIRNNAVGA